MQLYCHPTKSQPPKQTPKQIGPMKAWASAGFQSLRKSEGSRTNRPFVTSGTDNGLENRSGEN